jgi:hypothetical protein
LTLRRLIAVSCVVAATIWCPRAALAQVTPAAGYTPPDDAPSIRVGAVIYADYTYQQNPTAADSDGNTVNPSAFNVARTYINVQGQVNHVVQFRITPDIVRQSGVVSLGAGSSVSNDSLIFRLKYGFLQLNLDDWMWRGTYARFGIQQTPLIDYEEGIYRYRFQGTTFTEREGFYNSADGGASIRLNFPNNYGEVHVGIFNGEGYAKTDPNDQKAVEVRGTIRPFAQQAPVLRGLRLTGFYFGDHYVKDAERERAVGQVTFEHKFLNAGFDAIKAHDQTSIKLADVEASGWSYWATPRKPFDNGSSVEMLLRYDHLQPNTAAPANRTRTIIGVAYWFPHTGGPTASILLDYDGQTFQDFPTAQPAQKKIAVHGLINF